MGSTAALGALAGFTIFLRLAVGRLSFQAPLIGRRLRSGALPSTRRTIVRRRVIVGLVAVAPLAAGGAGVAAAAGGSTAGSGSRLDDGKDLLPQAGISEAQAIAAARGAAQGALN